MTNPTNNNSENTLTPEQVIEMGQKIYAEKLKEILEPEKRGEFVVIEVESGDYFVGKTVIDALGEARKKYPSRVFHTIKIGFEGIFKMGTSARRGFSYGFPSSR